MTQLMVNVEQKRILKEGRNCWRIAQANRAVFLVDAASYYAAFVGTVRRAKKSILILGWDIDSRVSLLRGNVVREQATRLAEFLNSIISQRRSLHAHILIWNYSFIFALERELLPALKFGLRTHRRLHFSLDGNHPLGASHHQKIVVVDDAVAFVGGLDLTRCRWDTSEHLAYDPLRSDGNGQYRPFHDVQMMVEGEVAAVLGELARERWWRATGERIKAVLPGGDPWPPGLVPDAHNVPVAVVRTEPAFEGYPEVREVEALYVDAISEARHFIFIENQYFTSSSVAKALAGRLQESNGPEIVIVLPHKSSGWLEERTMDALRVYLLGQLRGADRFGRLRMYYPVVPGGESVNVHSKVLIVDDTLLRIGSANLSNRSMGLDTECDLAIEAAGEARTEKVIAEFRSRLLGEHLGAPPEKVAEMTLAGRSLIGVVDELRGGERTLEPLNHEVAQFEEDLMLSAKLFDPERPADPTELVDEFIPEEVKYSGHGQLTGSVILLLVLLGIAVAWRWTPLKEYFDLDTLSYWANYIRGNPMAPFIVLAAYMIGSLVMFPVTLLIIATAITFGPVIGFVYSFISCIASAVGTYGIGHLLGHKTVRRFAGRRLYYLSRRMARRGLIAVFTIRILPIAPFSVVNLIIGASHIRFRDFILGTALGMIPGILSITVLGDSLESAIRDPGWRSFAVLVGLVGFIVSVNLGIRWWLARRNGPEE